MALRVSSGASLKVRILAPSSPFHGQQAFGRQIRVDRRDAHLLDPVEHEAVERGVLRLAGIIEFLAQPCANLLDRLTGVDRGAHSAMDRKQHVELLQVGLDRRCHVRILQLAGERRVVTRRGTMDLAERGGRSRLEVEAAETVLPVEPEFGRHPATHEATAHRGRLVLQLLQFFGVFGRNGVGDRREQLRDLH